MWDQPIGNREEVIRREGTAYREKGELAGEKIQSIKRKGKIPQKRKNSLQGRETVYMTNGTQSVGEKEQPL